MIVRTQRKWITHTTGGNIKGYSVFDSLAVSYRTKLAITIQPNNYTLSCLSQGNGNVYSHKNLFTSIHSSFTPISQNAKNPDVLQWINDSTNCGTSIGEIPLSSKKKQIIDTYDNYD